MNATTKTNTGRLFARLARLGRKDDAAFLARLVVARNAVANDNLPPPDGMGVDSELIMRPTEEEIRRASIRVKDGKPDPNGEIGLRFNDKGRLIEYRVAAEDGTPAINKEGKELWLRPREGYRQPKGGRRKTSRELSANNSAHGSWLMSLRGAGTIPPSMAPDTRYPSLGELFDRPAAAMAGFAVPSKLREEIVALGVDGGRTLEQCADANPFATIARRKVGIAWKVDFLAGKPDSGGTATEGSFVGAPDAAEMTMIATMDANAVKIGDKLEMALAGMTLREIAVAHGHNDNKGGEEWAARAVDKEIEELKKVAA
ncbi:hypothetical protein [Bradyrhizobium sp. STM 3561]|uniref:hypothetical protein n=1 Tax=Bradyrhizobium sp. STM 3561 TaxID=578923 RepID=UPI00388DC58F